MLISNDKLAKMRMAAKRYAESIIQDEDFPGWMDKEKMYNRLYVENLTGRIKWHLESIEVVGT